MDARRARRTPEFARRLRRAFARPARQCAAALRGRAVWASGTKSWFTLAAQGVWVQGCAEGLGAEAAATLVTEPVLRLPPPGAVGGADARRCGGTLAGRAAGPAPM